MMLATTKVENLEQFLKIFSTKGAEITETNEPLRVPVGPV